MGRSKSSSRWMQEHFEDEYVKMAQAQGYRSRAVFKLKEIQDKDQLIKPGMNIAITAGSRGIANVDVITKAIVDYVKSQEAKPFIVPAMGSHGGASAAGQIEILAGYNITEETMGCPIKSCMDTVLLGTSELGKPVYLDKIAY